MLRQIPRKYSGQRPPRNDTLKEVLQLRLRWFYLIYSDIRFFFFKRTFPENSFQVVAEDHFADVRAWEDVVRRAGVNGSREAPHLRDASPDGRPIPRARADSLHLRCNSAKTVVDMSWALVPGHGLGLGPWTSPRTWSLGISAG